MGGGGEGEARTWEHHKRVQGGFEDKLGYNNHLKALGEGYHAPP